MRTHEEKEGDREEGKGRCGIPTELWAVAELFG